MQFVQHSDQCPPVDPFDTSLLPCTRCQFQRDDPYWTAGPAKVTCDRCGQTDVSTSTDLLFAGYADSHNLPGKEWRTWCPGSHHHHGRPTVERSGRPGWVPLAHIVPGDIVRTRHDYPRPHRTDHQVLYKRPADYGRLSIGWLISCGVGGTGGAPGTPILLVKAADGPPPQAHTRVHFSNAISTRGREEYCYRTREEADSAIATHRPWNNTRAEPWECWRTDCFPSA